MFAYYLGVTSGAAILVLGIKTLLIIGLIWGITLPLSIMIFNRYLPMTKANHVRNEGSHRSIGLTGKSIPC